MTIFSVSHTGRPFYGLIRGTRVTRTCCREFGNGKVILFKNQDSAYRLSTNTSLPWHLKTILEEIMHFSKYDQNS